jgi:hypothetical protein
MSGRDAAADRIPVPSSRPAGPPCVETPVRTARMPSAKSERQEQGRCRDPGGRAGGKLTGAGGTTPTSPAPPTSPAAKTVDPPQPRAAAGGPASVPAAPPHRAAPVRLHDLRHGAASLAHEAGADLKTVQGPTRPRLDRADRRRLHQCAARRPAPRRSGHRRPRTGRRPRRARQDHEGPQRVRRPRRGIRHADPRHPARRPRSGSPQPPPRPGTPAPRTEPRQAPHERPPSTQDEERPENRRSARGPEVTAYEPEDHGARLRPQSSRGG